jgi:hypothetical protein
MRRHPNAVAGPSRVARWDYVVERHRVGVLELSSLPLNPSRHRMFFGACIMRFRLTSGSSPRSGTLHLQESPSIAVPGDAGAFRCLHSCVGGRLVAPGPLRGPDFDAPVDRPQQRP